MWFLFAQADNTVGVLSLLIQGGAFALLTYLVVWGWPAYRREETASRDKLLTDFRDERERDRNVREKMLADFREDLKAERITREAEQDGFQKRNEMLAGMIRGNQEIVTKAFESIREVLTTATNEIRRDVERLEIRATNVSIAPQGGKSGDPSGGR